MASYLLITLVLLAARPVLQAVALLLLSRLGRLPVEGAARALWTMSHGESRTADHGALGGIRSPLRQHDSSVEDDG